METKLDYISKVIDNTLDLINKCKELEENLKTSGISVNDYIELEPELNQWHKNNLQNYEIAMKIKNKI